MEPRPAHRSDLAHHWVLDPNVVFLNHGSFGACPRAILDAQHALHLELEREPLIFLDRDFERRMRTAREALGAFVGADPDDLTPQVNATAGVNSILRSLDFKPGDELLVTDHEYNACKNALAYVARRSGARLKLVTIPFPIRSEDEAVQAILSGVTPTTRLALIDHITSPTGLVLPIARIVAELNARGVDTLVDGAHAPGQVPLDLNALNAAYYTGNLHKWLCAPKGAAFLWVRRDRQDGIHPLSISHGFNAGASGNRRFRLEFDWTGTADPTPFLCVPDCIAFLDNLLPGGIAEIRRRNHAMALIGRDILCDALSCNAPCPDSMIGSMASIPLPDLAEPEDTSNPMEPIDPLRTRLLLEYGIEAHIVAWPAKPRRLTRLSAQVYNTEEAFHLYAAALKREFHL